VWQKRTILSVLAPNCHLCTHAFILLGRSYNDGSFLPHSSIVSSSPSLDITSADTRIAQLIVCSRPLSRLHVQQKTQPLPPLTDSPSTPLLHHDKNAHNALPIPRPSPPPPWPRNNTRPRGPTPSPQSSHTALPRRSLRTPQARHRRSETLHVSITQTGERRHSGLTAVASGANYTGSCDYVVWPLNECIALND